MSSHNHSGSGMLMRAGTEIKTSFYKNQSILSQHEPSEHYDFISVLGLAQARDIDFLPITWQPALGGAGLGGSAKVNQMIVSLTMSLVFKVVRVVDQHRQFNQRLTHQALSREIAILTRPLVRGHPNIIQLEGLCWDIDSKKDEILPVLVFERASYNDATNFFAEDEATRLSFEDRLGLCVDIGNALQSLHSCHIVHGDVKPENILIAKDQSDVLNAKLADFGFSLSFSEDELLQLPRSRPWQAPEISYLLVDFEQAKAADVYSYGMLCLWLLFHDRAIENPLEKEKDCWYLNNPYGHLQELEKLKSTNTMKAFAQNAVARYVGKEHPRREQLLRFFHCTLEKCGENPSNNLRQLDISILCDYLGRANVTNNWVLDIDTTEARFDPAGFHIPMSLYQFARSDYRIRRLIATELERVAETHECNGCQLNAAYQLALAYRLGFGFGRDTEKSAYWLRRSDRDLSWGSYLENLPYDVRKTCFAEEQYMEYSCIDIDMTLLKDPDPAMPYSNKKMNDLYYSGLMTQMDYANEYRAVDMDHLELAKATYRREIRDATIELGDFHEVTVALRIVLGTLEKECGNLREARKLRLSILQEMEKHPKFGPEHPETLFAMTALAEIIREEGEYEAAEQMLQRAFKRQEATVGFESGAMLVTASNLADVLQAQGEYEQAEELNRRVLTAKQNIHGDYHINTIISMNNLGGVLLDQDRLEDAEAHWRQAEQVAKRFLGAANYWTLVITNNLAAALHLQDKSKEAIQMLRQSLQECETLLGPSNPHTLMNMRNLAIALLVQGKYTEGKELNRCVVDRFKNSFGPEHQSTLEAVSNLAMTEEQAGNYKAAEAMCREVFDAFQRKLGKRHPRTLTSAEDLATTLHSQEKDAEARELFEYVLQEKELKLGENSVETLLTVHNLAGCVDDEGQHAEAKALFQRAYEGLVAARGETHSVTLRSLSCLASVYGKLHELDMAETMSRRALEGFKALGEDELATVHASSRLAKVLERGGKNEEAEQLYRQALHLAENIFEEESHDVLLAVGGLVRVLYELGRNEEALELAERANAGMERLLGPDHTDSRNAASNLRIVLKRRDGEGEE